MTVYHKSNAVRWIVEDDSFGELGMLARESTPVQQTYRASWAYASFDLEKAVSALTRTIELFFTCRGVYKEALKRETWLSSYVQQSMLLVCPLQMSHCGMEYPRAMGNDASAGQQTLLPAPPIALRQEIFDGIKNGASFGRPNEELIHLPVAYNVASPITSHIQFKINLHGPTTALDENSVLNVLSIVPGSRGFCLWADGSIQILAPHLSTAQVAALELPRLEGTTISVSRWAPSTMVEEQQDFLSIAASQKGQSQDDSRTSGSSIANYSTVLRKNTNNGIYSTEVQHSDQPQYANDNHFVAGQKSVEEHIRGNRGPLMVRHRQSSGQLVEGRTYTKLENLSTRLPAARTGSRKSVEGMVTDYTNLDSAALEGSQLPSAFPRLWLPRSMRNVTLGPADADVQPAPSRGEGSQIRKVQDPEIANGLINLPTPSPAVSSRASQEPGPATAPTRPPPATPTSTPPPQPLLVPPPPPPHRWLNDRCCITVGTQTSTAGVKVRRRGYEGEYLTISTHAAYNGVNQKPLPLCTKKKPGIFSRKPRAPVSILNRIVLDADNKEAVGPIASTADAPNAATEMPVFPNDFMHNVSLVGPLPAGFRLPRRDGLCWSIRHAFDNVPVRILGDHAQAKTIGCYYEAIPVHSEKKKLQLSQNVVKRSLLFRRDKSPFSDSSSLSGAPVVTKDDHGNYVQVVGFQAFQFQPPKAQAEELDQTKSKVEQRLRAGQVTICGAIIPGNSFKDTWQIVSDV